MSEDKREKALDSGIADISVGKSVEVEKALAIADQALLRKVDRKYLSLTDRIARRRN